ncbi:unnamed protein product [Orchesella dallaii]|uniref:Uncharacterized protein n=1 Tax=Orchesella dallaii TaxID=48710 RepID=A0ABP1QR98_9HEXA
MANLEPLERSAAQLQLRVNNVSSLHGIVQTEPICIRNLQWRLRVKPSFDASGNKQALGVFLYCEGLRGSKTWSCNAAASFRLIPQKRGLVAYSEEINSKFHSGAMDWGYAQFYEWIPLKGYINADGDYLDLEADIQADEPNYEDLEVSQQVMARKRARLEPEVGAEKSTGVLRWRTIASNILRSRNWDWHSQPTFIRGLKWRVAVEPELGLYRRKSLGIYVRCRADGHLDKAQWKCTANIRFMVKAKKERGLIGREMTHVFQSGSINQAGFSNMIDVEDFVNPFNGCLKYNNIEIEVRIQAEVVIITTRPENVAQNVEDPERIMTTVGEIQSRSLECPICFEIPRAEIYQCSNGHIICTDCKSKLNICPQCQIPYRVDGQLIRNRAVEAIILELPAFQQNPIESPIES